MNLGRPLRWYGTFVAVISMVAGALLGVALTTSSAAADPYPATVATDCGVGSAHAFKVGDQVRIRVRVTANHTTRTANRATGPQGRVKITVNDPSGHRVFSRTVTYPGHAVTVDGPQITKRGTYRIATRFAPADSSQFKRCTGSAGIKAGPKNGGDSDDDPGTDTPGTHTPGTHTPGDSGDGLPNTGGPERAWLYVALAMLLSGAALTLYGRRSKVTTPSQRRTRRPQSPSPRPAA